MIYFAVRMRTSSADLELLHHGECDVILHMETYEEFTEQTEEGKRHVREELIPALEGIDGLMGAFWALDEEAGQRRSFMLWRDEPAMKAGMIEVMSRVQKLRLSEGRASPAEAHRDQIFEVFASFTGGARRAAPSPPAS